MAKYKLQPNESVIMKLDQVMYGGLIPIFINELILTNLNIVLVRKGILGNAKGFDIFPLNQVKVFNGQAQVLLGKTRNGFLIDVYLLNGQESFGFQSKKEAIKLIASINKLITGNEGEVGTSPSMAIPGAEYIVETLKGTMETFKGAWGIKSKNNNEMPTKVAKKCISCGASISGTKGQIIRCQYCDADQHL